MEAIDRVVNGRKPLCGGKSRNYYSVIILGALAARSGIARGSVIGGWQTQHFARFGEGTLASGRARTWPATDFLPCSSRLPTEFFLLRASRSLTLDLETQVELETAGLDLGAEVMKVAQFVVHGFGAFSLGAKATLEFVQDRLALLRRHTGEVTCGNLALIGD